MGPLIDAPSVANGAKPGMSEIEIARTALSHTSERQSKTIASTICARGNTNFNFIRMVEHL